MQTKNIFLGVLAVVLLVLCGVLIANRYSTPAPSQQIATTSDQHVNTKVPPLEGETIGVPPGTPPSANTKSPTTVKTGATKVAPTTPPSPSTGVAGALGTAKEFVFPTGFFNIEALTIRPNMTDLTMKDLLGKYVIAIEFFSSSDISSQQTLPYLEAWQQKYDDLGLMVVGIHTPEFNFEREKNTINNTLQKFGVHFPVVMDNNFGSWNAYVAKKWPTLFLININGGIVYKHVGSGDYATIEKKIQSLLEERANKLRVNLSIPATIAAPNPMFDIGKVRTPKLFFGSAVNSSSLTGAIGGVVGKQELTASGALTKNDVMSLAGTWDFTKEYASPMTPNASIAVNYGAKNVYALASATKLLRARVLLDGAPLGARKGADIVEEKGESILYVQYAKVYQLVNDSGNYGEHKLEIIFDQPGVQMYTLMFN